mmetsp:Transcript_23815/g.32464  ORF Transcript_23815/g.32464 Transcript_23815/m.32464 type:complete len:85 (-) Transcript_23815:119-373(-)
MRDSCPIGFLMLAAPFQSSEDVHDLLHVVDVTALCDVLGLWLLICILSLALSGVSGGQATPWTMYHFFWVLGRRRDHVSRASLL